MNNLRHIGQGQPGSLIRTTRLDSSNNYSELLCNYPGIKKLDPKFMHKILFVPFKFEILLAIERNFTIFELLTEKLDLENDILPWQNLWNILIMFDNYQEIFNSLTYLFRFNGPSADHAKAILIILTEYHQLFTIWDAEAMVWLLRHSRLHWALNVLIYNPNLLELLNSDYIKLIFNYSLNPDLTLEKIVHEPKVLKTIAQWAQKRLKLKTL